jgi:hypothetical protein
MATVVVVDPGMELFDTGAELVCIFSAEPLKSMTARRIFGPL